VNVLHVHSGNMFGGVERMLQTLAPATAGIAPIHSSFALCFEGRVSDALRAAGGTVHHIGAVRARRIDEIWRARRALRRVLASQQWSAAFVHSAWSQAIFGPTILNGGAPLVRWLHAPQPGPRWLEYWSGRSRPALILCNSCYTRDTAGSRLGAVPLSVQYPPAVLQESTPAGAREAVRSALGTPADAVVVILAARLEAGKGHKLLIDALAQLRSPRWEAWIVGGVQREAEQAYLDGLRQQAATAGMFQRIRFLGQRDDVQALLGAADVYCQPNHSPDSFGLSFVEALSAALPVITTRMGAAPEIVVDGCGLLIEPESVPALADALRRLIERNDERREMSAAARIRAREFCDLSRSLPQLAAELVRASTAAPALT
jgi:glycosyltransferase involved in cell wall biosynthesis